MESVFIKYIFLLGSISPCHAQEISSDSIKDIVWIDDISDPNEIDRICFTDSCFCDITTYKFNGKTLTNKHPFYLSKTRPNTFNNSLVGEKTSGKYIVVKYNDTEIGIFEIKELTKETLSITFEWENTMTFRKERTITKTEKI